MARLSLDYLEFDFSTILYPVDDIVKGAKDLGIELSQERAPFLKVVTKEYIEEMLGYADRFHRVTGKYRDLVCVGIGGSSLGTKTIFHALLGLPGLTDKRFFFLENVDPQFVEAVFRKLDWEKALFIFISKSGRTLETVSLLNAVINELKRRGVKNFSDRFVFISDPGSNFHRLAQELKAIFFPIPKEIGGRYSVLTPVGLIPSEFFGIRSIELLEGAKRVVDRYNDLKESHPSVILGYWKAFNYLEKGRNISVMMVYSERLRTFADWYAQLWAESLGKDGRGQTPLPAMGTVDQHSLLQLFMEGPDDKVYQLIKLNFKENVDLGDEGLILEYIKGKNLRQVIDAEFHGTLGALREVKRPVVAIEVKELSAMALGELFMTYEIATYVASLLLKVNPYNQPGVELGKKIARELLAGGE